MGNLKGDYLGEFEQIVLLALARLDGESYAVPIRREIEEKTGRQASLGSIYATLSRVVGEFHKPIEYLRFLSLIPSGA